MKQKRVNLFWKIEDFLGILKFVEKLPKRFHLLPNESCISEFLPPKIQNPLHKNSPHKNCPGLVEKTLNFFIGQFYFCLFNEKFSILDFNCKTRDLNHFLSSSSNFLIEIKYSMT
jgi:hypothetical protein